VQIFSVKLHIRNGRTDCPSVS